MNAASVGSNSETTKLKYHKMNKRTAFVQRKKPVREKCSNAAAPS